MHAQIASEIWGELQRFMGGSSDRAEAADVLVSVLINNDEHAEDIARAFGNDRDIKAALSSYLNDDLESDDDEDPDEDQEEW
jgi:hypothetical protein